MNGVVKKAKLVYASSLFIPKYLKEKKKNAVYNLWKSG